MCQGSSHFSRFLHHFVLKKTNHHQHKDEVHSVYKRELRNSYIMAMDKNRYSKQYQVLISNG